jgi:hypothetical protein
MNKDIRTVKNGIVQITTVDERWYAKSVNDAVTNLPIWTYVPSVTWIVGFYPKGIGFYKWLAEKGWDEAEAIKEAAGDRGSKVHAALTDLLDGKTVAMDAQCLNPSTEQLEPLSLEEYDAILSFARWHERVKPVLVARDVTVWNDQEGYAGTVDFVCTINGQLWIVDFKTSQSVWPSHELQLTGYKHADHDWGAANLAVLQLGYKRNKDGFKWNPVNDDWLSFLSTKVIWARETAGQKPAQRDYPVQVSLVAKPVVTPRPTVAKVINGKPNGAKARV